MDSTFFEDKDIHDEPVFPDSYMKAYDELYTYVSSRGGSVHTKGSKSLLDKPVSKQLVKNKKYSSVPTLNKTNLIQRLQKAGAPPIVNVETEEYKVKNISNLANVFQMYAKLIYDYNLNFRVSSNPYGELIRYLEDSAIIPTYLTYSPKDPVLQKLAIYKNIYSDFDGTNDLVVKPIIAELQKQFHIYTGGISALHSHFKKPGELATTQSAYRNTRIPESSFATYPEFAKRILRESIIEEYLMYGHTVIYLANKNPPTGDTIMKSVIRILEKLVNLRPFIVRNNFTNCVSIVIYDITIIEIYCYDYFIHPGGHVLNIQDLLLMNYRSYVANTTVFIPEKHTLIDFLEFITSTDRTVNETSMRTRFKTITQYAEITPSVRNTLSYIYDKYHPDFKSNVDNIVYNYLKPIIFLFAQLTETELNKTCSSKIIPAGGAVFNFYNEDDINIPNDYDYKIYLLQEIDIDVVFKFIATKCADFIAYLVGEQNNAILQQLNTYFKDGVFQNIRYQVRGTRAASRQRVEAGWTGKVNLCSIDIFVDYYIDYGGGGLKYIRTITLNAIDFVIYEKNIGIYEAPYPYLISESPYYLQDEENTYHQIKLPSIFCSLCNILNMSILTRVFNKIQKDIKRFLYGIELLHNVLPIIFVSKDPFLDKITIADTIDILMKMFEHKLIVFVDKKFQSISITTIAVDLSTTKLNPLLASLPPSELPTKRPYLTNANATQQLNIPRGTVCIFTQDTRKINFSEITTTMQTFINTPMAQTIALLVSACFTKKGRFSKIFSDICNIDERPVAPVEPIVDDEQVFEDKPLEISKEDIKKYITYFTTHDRTVRSARRKIVGADSAFSALYTTLFDKIKSKYPKILVDLGLDAHPSTQSLEVNLNNYKELQTKITNLNTTECKKKKKGGNSKRKVSKKQSSLVHVLFDKLLKIKM